MQPTASEAMSLNDSGMGSRFRHAGVVEVVRCRLHVSAGEWAYAGLNAAAIDAHWARRTSESALLFNGRVFLLTRNAIEADEFRGAFVATDFKSFLHWRESGHPEAGVRDCFGASLIVSCDGAVLLGRQRPGQVNSGLLYPPSGFIDPSDVAADGTIDIAGNMAREIAEETGLDARLLCWEEGFRIAFSGPQVAIGRVARSTMSASALSQAVRDHIARDERPELAGVETVHALDEAGSDLPAYARLLLASVLSGS